MTREELEVAMAFARLELLELEHGRRAITDCPGIEALAKEAATERARQRFAALKEKGRECDHANCDVVAGEPGGPYRYSCGRIEG